MTTAEVESVNDWIRGCKLAWIECQSPDNAQAPEQALHAEWMLPLS